MSASKSKINFDNMPQDLSLYRHIFTKSFDCVAILNSEGEYIEQNAAHQKLFGLTDFDIIGETPSVIFGEEKFKKIIDRLKEKGAYTGEVHAADKNGNELTTNLSAFALRKNDIKPANYVYILRNITEGEGIIFFLRDPTSRFVSGFYSRQRQGQPRYYSPWSSDEKIGT